MKARELSASHGCLVLLALLASAPWHAFVFARFWLWFVVPIGLPSLGLAQAAGIQLLVAWFRHRSSRPADLGDGDVERALGDVWIAPGVFLALGWLAHLLMVRS